jgi:diacylglycerol kinase family enzyme
MSTSSTKPAATRRSAAAAAVLIVIAVIVITVAAVLGDPLTTIAELLLLVVAFVGVWWALTRRGASRWAAVALTAGAAVAIVVLQVSRDVSSIWSLLARLVALGGAVLLARYALGRDVRSLKETRTPGRPAPPARHGVLIMNLKSGGGKAEKFHLEDECRARGIEPVVLRPGDDLLELAREAADRGADVLGMAGGDGSQALVSSVAAERGLPMVVVPAGTRNHFALDVGLDRDDVVGALDAYGDALEQTVDLADVNGHVFVNNVSLGLYAEIVSSPAYRDNKAEVTLSALPEMIGPDSAPFDLRFDTPDGGRQTGAHVIQVSNGPYGTTPTTLTSRPRLDTGELGVLTLMVPDAASATRAVAAVATSKPELYEGYMTWSAPAFEVTSGAPVPVGLDGESLALDPPLVFRSRPGVLRLRLPQHAIGYSPAARAVRLRDLAQLWSVIAGRSAGPPR